MHCVDIQMTTNVEDANGEYKQDESINTQNKRV